MELRVTNVIWDPTHALGQALGVALDRLLVTRDAAVLKAVQAKVQNPVSPSVIKLLWAIDTLTDIMPSGLKVLPAALRSFSCELRKRVGSGEWCPLCDLLMIAVAWLMYMGNTCLCHYDAATTFLEVARAECQCKHCVYVRKGRLADDERMRFAA